MQVQATLHQAQMPLTYTTILSPTDGVVIARNIDAGQTVAASVVPTIAMWTGTRASITTNHSIGTTWKVWVVWDRMVR